MQRSDSSQLQPECDQTDNLHPPDPRLPQCERAQLSCARQHRLRRLHLCPLVARMHRAERKQLQPACSSGGHRRLQLRHHGLHRIARRELRGHGQQQQPQLRAPEARVHRQRGHAQLRLQCYQPVRLPLPGARLHGLDGGQLLQNGQRGVRHVRVLRWRLPRARGAQLQPERHARQWQLHLPARGMHRQPLHGLSRGRDGDAHGRLCGYAGDAWVHLLKRDQL